MVAATLEEGAHRWIPLERDYAAELARNAVVPTRARRDPLGASISSRNTAGGGGSEDDEEDGGGGGDAFDAADRAAGVEGSSAGGGGGGATGGGATGGGATGGSSAPADDPLSLAAAEVRVGVDDPLSGMGMAESVGEGGGEEGGMGAKDGDADAEVNPFANGTFEPWESKTSSVLQRYTTSRLITLVTKEAGGPGGPAPVVTSSGGGGGAGGAGGEAGAPSEKTASRLAQLDDTAEGTERKVLQMSQKEYTDHIRHLNEELKVAWQHDERVKAIKIAIQTSKFLTEASVPQFYPSMFVLVAEVLDTFGRLVYQRISTRAAEISGAKLPAKFTADDVPAEARETCRNWFYKIASIRELLPRVYVELAMLGSYRFIAEKGDFPVILARIVAMIRGVGDPLVAAYARMYLARVGVREAPWAREYLVANVTDMMLVFRPQLTGAGFRSMVESRGSTLTVMEYYDLFAPALDWTLQCAGHETPKEVFFAVVDRYVKHCGSAVVLHAILNTFPAKTVSTYAGKVMDIVKGADYASLDRSAVYGALVRALVAHPPPKKDRLSLLSDIWKVVRKFDSLPAFVEVARVFVGYPLRYFSPREVNTVLGDVHRRLQSSQARKQLPRLLPALHPMLSSVLDHYPFHRVLRMDNFMPLVDMFRGETDIARALLRAFADVGVVAGGPSGGGGGDAAANNAEQAKAARGDSFVVQMMFDCARALHDHAMAQIGTAILTSGIDPEAAAAAAAAAGDPAGSSAGPGAITSSSPASSDEALLRAFVLKADFGTDLERHLAFLVDCRGALGGMDSVQAALVHCACGLAMRALRLVRGKHSKRTVAFAKACVAFCFITVPSLANPLQRMALHTLSAEVAIANGLSAQAEACLRGAVTSLAEVPHHAEGEATIRSTDPELSTRLQRLVGALVAAPGHPEQGPYFIVNGLAKALQGYTFAPGSATGLHCRCDLIQLLSAQYQRRLPPSVHVQGLMSNADLFGGDPAFQEETLTLIDLLLTDLVELLSTSSSSANAKGDLQPRQVVEVTGHLLSALASSASVTRTTAQLALNVFKMGMLAARNASEKRTLEGAVAGLSGGGDNGRALAARLAKIAAEKKI